MTARTPPPLSESDRPDVLQSLRDGWSLDDAARGFRRKGADVLADADANGWRGDLDAAIAEGQRQAASEAPAPTVAPSPPVETAEDRRAQWVKAALATQAQSEAIAPAAAKPNKRAAEHTEGDHMADVWARRREEATALAPGYFGYLLWVERKCVDGGLHAMDPQWLYHFEQFYASGKFLDVGRFGLRAAKSDSVCRALVAEVLLIERRLEPSIVGVCPIMSSDMREAGGRFDTVRANLRACGYMELLSTSRALVDGGSFKTSGGGNQGHKIELLDSQGHEVEFRIYPASETGAAGYTGIAGFGDELDLWGKAGSANPASKVVKILLTRYTTQPEARLHLMSATYDRASYHAALIDGGTIDGKEVIGGDTPLRRVARLGQRGAEKDYADRKRLAAIHGLTDPMLLAPSDPESVNIPSWVSNPIATIEDCYAKAEGDIRAMFSLYGARPDLAGACAMTAADIDAFADVNRALNQPEAPRGTFRRDGLLTIPGYDDDGKSVSGGGFRGL